MVVVAAPAAAQSDRVIHQAFAPSITPFVGATGFGTRTTQVSDGAKFDYNNGVAFGVQLDHPLTRRTGLIATASITPFTRVIGTRGSTVVDLDKAVVGGIDLEFAGRLKPNAPLFVYVGGGAVLATKQAVFAPDGFEADPRASVGVGLDFVRHEDFGVRFMYLAHWVKPSSPDESLWTAESSAFDQTFMLGARIRLGKEGDAR